MLSKCNTPVRPAVLMHGIRGNNIPVKRFRAFRKYNMFEVLTMFGSNEGSYYIHYDLGLWILKHAQHHWKGSYVYFDDNNNNDKGG